MRKALAIAVLHLLVFIAACESGPPSTENPDDAAKNGCEHYINVMDDARRGVLTEAALIKKIDEVYNSLKYSEVPALASRAEALQRAMVRNSGVASATERLAEICIDIMRNASLPRLVDLEATS